MQTINGRTKLQHLRTIALGILENKKIPTIFNCGADCFMGFVTMHKPSAKTVRVEYRVVEDSNGWCFQRKSCTKAKWKTTIRGSWLSTQQLFEAIDRRVAIHRAQTKRLTA